MMMLKMLLSAVLMLAFIDGVLASACVKPKTEQIRFTPGSHCWDYEGTATHFVGSFTAGQTVRVEMHGVSRLYDETYAKKTKIEWGPRWPNIFGPDEEMVTTSPDGGEGTIDAKLPKSGKYKFGFGPCAMWNYYGLVRICTRP